MAMNDLYEEKPPRNPGEAKKRRLYLVA